MKREDIQPDAIVRHIGKGGLYRITGERLTKIDGEWRTTIDYVPADGRAGAFGREIEPFSENFELVTPAPDNDTGRLIVTAEAYAAKYDGDDRQDIKTDVLNAFYQGAFYRKHK